MPFLCLTCRASLQMQYKNCPGCGDAISDFQRSYYDTPVGGNYQLVKKLGRGGMGEVYKAHHLDLQADRVIKVMNPSSNTGAGERFLREARVALKIRHRNVATTQTESDDGHKGQARFQETERRKSDTALPSASSAPGRLQGSAQGTTTRAEHVVAAAPAEAKHDGSDGQLPQLTTAKVGQKEAPLSAQSPTHIVVDLSMTATASTYQPRKVDTMAPFRGMTTVIVTEMAR
jgi:hypothetical protein